jgi:hypothetical protein
MRGKAGRAALLLEALTTLKAMMRSDDIPIKFQLLHLNVLTLPTRGMWIGSADLFMGDVSNMSHFAQPSSLDWDYH